MVAFTVADRGDLAIMMLANIGGDYSLPISLFGELE